VFCLQDQQSDIHLAPITPSFIVQLAQHLSNVMVAIIYANVMIRPLKFLICTQNRIIPLLRCVVLVIEDHIFQRGSECQLSIVHRSPSHKIINSTIWPAYSSVTDTGHAAGDAGKSSPNNTVWISLLIDVHLHLHLKLWLHLYYLNINDILDIFVNIFYK
jgi:hypothetical protein